jgi:hypothetical protein
VEHLKIPAVRSKSHHHNRQRRVVVRTTVDVEAGFRREAADPALVLVPFNFQKAHGPGRPPTHSALHCVGAHVANCILTIILVES